MRGDTESNQILMQLKLMEKKVIDAAVIHDQKITSIIIIHLV